MTMLPYTLKPIEAERLPDGQAAWVENLVGQYLDRLGRLTNEDRGFYAQMWKQMARQPTPVGVRAGSHTSPSTGGTQRTATNLDRLNLLWFDGDLRAILKCPPFSALHTTHEVKAFGWERTFASSFIDIPLTLLLYGPNMWLTGTSRCPRSGEKVTFRVRMNEDYQLRFEAPSNQWCIWLPLPQPPSPEVYDEFHSLRPRIHAFYSRADLDIHCEYQECAPGIVYSLEQSLYLSECLMQAYRYAVV